MKIMQYIFTSLLLVFLFGSTMEAQTKKPTIGPDIPRKALVRNDCLINQSVEVVGVGTGSGDRENLLDEDLSNSVHFVSVVSVGAVLNPIVHIKDTKHFYAAGTKAGFCIEAGSGSALLSLNVLEHTSIMFYKGDSIVGTKPVEQGGGAGLLNLGLIQIPGEQAVLHLSAEAPAEFDGIGLMFAGINVGVIDIVRIRYGFVGNAQEHPLVNKEKDNKIPIKMDTKNVAEKEKLINEDLTDCAKQAKVLIQTGAEITLKRDDGGLFKKGSEVGFLFKEIDVVDLAIGGTTEIIVGNSKLVSEKFLIDAKVLGLGAIQTEKKKISVIAPFDFDYVTLKIFDGIGLGIGGREFYYGFVTEPTEVSHVPDLFVSMDAYIGAEVTNYEMMSSKPSKWTLIKQPEGEGKLTLTPSENDTRCELSGMTPNLLGEYHIEVTPQDNCGCKETIVLIRGNVPGLPSECKEPLTGENVVFSDTIRGSSGSLLSISKLKYPEHLVDEDETTYAEYIGGLSVANNLMIAGVKTKDGEPFSEGEAAKKVGFLMETSTEVLDAKVLELFQIRLYNDGKEVFRKVIDNSDVAQVGAIGASKTSKTMFGVHVDENITFDEITIWKCGVLDLALSTMRIYSAHITKSELKCYEDPLACGSVVISTDDTGAHINHNKTGFSGLVTVAGVMTNVENVLDDDIDETCAHVGTGVGVGAAWSVSIMLGQTMDRSHQACVVLDKKTYTATIDLGASLKVELCLTGVDAPVTTRTAWDVLGVDAIGFGDKIYFFVTPTSRYDEIRISYQNILGIDLGQQEIYGVAVRYDVNNNGIADCIEQPMLLNAFTASDVCVGEQLFISGYGRSGAVYTVSSESLGLGEKEFSIDDEQGNFLWELGPAEKVQKSALITVKPKDPSDTEAPLLFVTVHPTRTKWTSHTPVEAEQKASKTTDWNLWDNWDRGTPWSCTDVIIPQSADSYPVLSGIDINACRYIHFEPGGEVVNTHHLKYEKAWVDVALKPNRYYMVAVPLKEMRSGDWFVPAQKDAEPLYPDTFAVLNEKTAPANRITPTIYQRVWESIAYNRLIAGGREMVYPGESRWTTPSNMLTAYYDLTDGFALSAWVHPLKPTEEEEGDANATYLFRFPKEHDMYYYVNEAGDALNLFEQMKRSKKQIGRFIYENADSTATLPFVERVKNESYENATFLVANPFMSHIDVKKLLDVNSHLTSVKVYDGTGSNSVVADVDEGFLIANPEANVAAYSKIAPLQSFFVTLDRDEGHETDVCEVTFTEEMLCAGPEAGAELKSARTAETKRAHSIYLKAGTAQAERWAMVRFSDRASEGFDEREDAEILLETGGAKGVELFTIADEKALEIQQRQRGGIIPVGLYVPDKQVAQMELSITMPDGYAEWQLEDLLEGKSYPLEAGRENSITLHQVSTNVGRFYLKGSTPLANETIQARPAKVFAYCEPDGNKLVIRSEEGMMKRCEIFTAQGALSGIAGFESDEYRMLPAQGINVIKVYLCDGRVETLKIMCH